MIPFRSIELIDALVQRIQTLFHFTSLESQLRGLRGKSQVCNTSTMYLIAMPLLKEFKKKLNAFSFWYYDRKPTPAKSTCIFQLAQYHIYSHYSMVYIYYMYVNREDHMTYHSFLYTQFSASRNKSSDIHSLLRNCQCLKKDCFYEINSTTKLYLHVNKSIIYNYNNYICIYI